MTNDTKLIMKLDKIIKKWLSFRQEMIPIWYMKKPQNHINQYKIEENGALGALFTPYSGSDMFFKGFLLRLFHTF